MSQTGTELINCSLEQKKELWEKEQLQKFAETGKEPKNYSWKNKYKGVAEIEGEIHELPSDWGWASAEAICSSVRDGTHDTPKYIEKGVPLITSKNLVEGKLDFSKIQMISEKDHEEISKRSGVDDGDILYAMIGTIGNPVVVKKLTEFSIKNVGLFKKNEEFIISNYLKYWLDAPQFNNWLKPRLKGTTQKFAPLGLLRALPVPVAPQEQQKRIVAKIEELFSHIDAGIEALKKAKQLLKQYRQSVLKAAVTGELTKEWREANKDKLESAPKLLERILKERRQKWEEQQLEQFKAKGKIPKDDKWTGKYKEAAAFGSDIEIPENWIGVTTDQVFYYITSGSRGWAKYYSEEGPIFIRMGNLEHYDVGLDLGGIQRVSPPEGAEGSRTKVEAGDSLISITADVGMVGVVPDDFEEAYINQHVSLARPVIRSMGLYLSWLLSGDFAKEQFKLLQRGATKVGLGLDDIKAIQFGLPSIEEQGEIARLIEEKLSLIEHLEAELDQQLIKAGKNKQSILASAFSGGMASG